MSAQVSNSKPYEIAVKYDARLKWRRWRWSVHYWEHIVASGRSFTRGAAEVAGRDAADMHHHDQWHYLTARQKYDPAKPWDC